MMRTTSTSKQLRFKQLSLLVGAYCGVVLQQLEAEQVGGQRSASNNNNAIIMTVSATTATR
jgi:hypothetical protein